MENDAGRAGKTIIAILFLTFAAVSPCRAVDLPAIDTSRLHAMVVDNAYELEGGRGKPFAIVDARAKEEYDAAHIFSAVNVPERNFEEAKYLLPADRGTLLVVYGDVMEPGTAEKWAMKARAAGYGNIAVYPEGFQAWKRKTMPVAPIR